MIVTDENILRIPCELVEESEIDHLISELEKHIPSHGVGLAAPQIGISKRAAIVRYKLFELNLINAKIISAYDQFLFDNEGCLSFPGTRRTKKRYREIVVSNMVEPKNFIITGFEAVIVQHELDHLDNILLIDD
jgi:peptide deformylase